VKLTYGPGAALVTGGSGGIGSAVALLLAGEGVSVGITYRSRRDRAEETVRLAGENAKVTAYPWSSASVEDAARLVQAVKKDLGKLAYLVSCHGIAQASAFHATPEAEWRGIVETNLTSTIALARVVVGPMMRAGPGRIVLVTSVSGLRGIPGHTVYAATKAGLHGFVRSLAQECAAFAVTVNAVAPGFVDTPMLSHVPENTRKALVQRIPMGRLGKPEDVAHVVRFLLSEQASYVTGQTWVVDGGLAS